MGWVSTLLCIVACPLSESNCRLNTSALELELPITFEGGQLWVVHEREAYRLSESARPPVK